MGEQSATREDLRQVELATRREAVSHLAADMLLMFGEAEDRWRSLTWQEGDRTYSLNRGDFTQFQTEQTDRHTNWLHVAGPNGEYDAYSLGPDGEFAAPDHEFVELADALERHATTTAFNLAQQRLQAGQAETSNMQLSEWRFQLRDFTAAEHDSFIVLTGRHTFGDTIGYDLTSREFRPISTRGADPRLSAQPHEAHLAWVLRVLATAEDEPQYGRAGRASTYTQPEQQRNPEGPATISDAQAEDAHSFMRILRGLPVGENMDVHVRGKVVIARTVFDYVSTQSDTTVPTAIGLYYNGNVLHMEAFSVGVHESHTAVYLDLAYKTATGARIVDGARTDLRGDTAAQELFDHTDLLAIAEFENGLRPCTPEIADRFINAHIRQNSNPDDVQ